MDKIVSSDPFGLKPLWNGILDVYEVFQNICKKYGLRQFATGGTAIGALRHKGFIPWDDDFDVAMPRPDYDKFLSVVEQELPPHLKLVNWTNTQEFGLLFSKIQDVRKEYVEEVEKACGFPLSNGVYIDIFPIDGDCPIGSAGAKIKRMRLKLLAALERFHCHAFAEQSRKGKIGWLLGMAIAPFFPFLRTHRQCLSKFEEILKGNPYEDDANTFIIGQGLTCHIPIASTGVWKQMTNVPFESVSIAISTKCEDYLRAQFGDYMQMPPENERHPSHSYAMHCAWWLGPAKR